MGGKDGSFLSDAVFAEMKSRAATDKELVKKADELVVRFFVSGANGQTKIWLVDLKRNPPFVGHDDSVSAEFDVTLSDETFMQLTAGTIRAEIAFMMGQLKLRGKIADSFKLQAIFDPSFLKKKE